MAGRRVAGARRAAPIARRRQTEPAAAGADQIGHPRLPLRRPQPSGNVRSQAPGAGRGARRIPDDSDRRSRYRRRRIPASSGEDHGSPRARAVDAPSHAQSQRGGGRDAHGPHAGQRRPRTFGQRVAFVSHAGLVGELRAGFGGPRAALRRAPLHDLQRGRAARSNARIFGWPIRSLSGGRQSQQSRFPDFCAGAAGRPPVGGAGFARAAPALARSFAR